MFTRLLVLAPLLLAAAFAHLRAQDLCTAARGASVVANDGEFLGKVTSSLDRESIFNEIGRFGSDISSTSIWNEIGKYGSKISRLSPFNDISSTPPALVKGGQIIGYLTVNQLIRGAVKRGRMFTWGGPVARSSTGIR